MDCHKANELLPAYVVDTLSSDECAQLLQHLENGCQPCRQETEELMVAASALAESLEPVTPRPEVKQALLNRIAVESQVDIAATVKPRSSEQATASPLRRRSYFPYIAASLGALVAGSLIANVVQRVGDTSPKATPQLTTQQWQQSLEAAEKAFGVPRAQLASLAKNVAGPGFRTAIFSDRIAGQLHVLVSETSPPRLDERLWFWLLDRQGNVLSGGPLDYLGQRRAAGVLESSELPQNLYEAILTSEPLGEHTKPSGSDVGRVRLERS